MQKFLKGLMIFAFFPLWVLWKLFIGGITVPKQVVVVQVRHG